MAIDRGDEDIDLVPLILFFLLPYFINLCDVGFLSDLCDRNR